MSTPPTKSQPATRKRSQTAQCSWRSRRRTTLLFGISSYLSIIFTDNELRELEARENAIQQ